MTRITVKPVIISPLHILTQPVEKFLLPGRGDCTWHTLYSQPLTPTDSLCAGIAVCPPQTGQLCPHRHSQAEIYYIISGTGVATIDGIEHSVQTGSSFFVPGNAKHGIVNTGTVELRWFYVFAAKAFDEIDYRFTHEALSQ